MEEPNLQSTRSPMTPAPASPDAPAAARPRASLPAWLQTLERPVYRGADIFFAVLPFWVYEILYLLVWTVRGRSASRLVGHNIGKIYFLLALGFVVAAAVHFAIGRRRLFARPWFYTWAGCAFYTLTALFLFRLHVQIPDARVHDTLVLSVAAGVLWCAAALVGSGWEALLMSVPIVLWRVPDVNRVLLAQPSYAMISLTCLVLATLFTALHMLARPPRHRWILMYVLAIAVCAVNLWAVSEVANQGLPADVIQKGYRRVGLETAIVLLLLLLPGIVELIKSRLGGGGEDAACCATCGEGDSARAPVA